MIGRQSLAMFRFLFSFFFFRAKWKKENREVHTSEDSRRENLNEHQFDT